VLSKYTLLFLKALYGNPSDMNIHMAKAKEAEAIDVLKVYELGSHIVSSLSEEEAGKVYESLKGLITKAGGAIIAEEAPQLMDLAYMMIKHVQGKNVRHTTAYFSWIKFEIDPTEIPAINEAVSADENILRYITVKTVKESTLYGHKFANEAKEGNGKREPRREKAETAEATAKPQAEAAPAEAPEADQASENVVNA
jgi:small subunit ribosomal protein S6